MNELTSLTGEPNEASQTSPPMHVKRRLGLLLALLLLITSGFGVWLYNNVIANKPLQRVLSADQRNTVVKAHAHFDGWLDVHTLVFNIDDVSGEARRADVLRVFLQYAQAMKEQRLKKVVLACKGTRKFEMSGAYFKQLGSEYDTQNPIYTMRTLPLNVTAMDGSHPYSAYEGGIFAVLAKEMEQFGDFSDRWYGRDFFDLSGAGK